MLKTILLFSALLSVTTALSSGKDFYDLSFTALNGEKVEMEAFKGQKVLIVNTASECGLAPQLETLQELSQKYEKHVKVIGFPSNDFANQEPLEGQDIADFCEEQFGATFMLADKVHVKGENIHPVYEWLTSKELNNFRDSEVKWNYQKYLINERGELTHVFSPDTEPLSSAVIEAVTD